MRALAIITIVAVSFTAGASLLTCAVAWATAELTSSALIDCEELTCTTDERLARTVLFKELGIRDLPSCEPIGPSSSENLP